MKLFFDSKQMLVFVLFCLGCGFNSVFAQAPDWLIQGTSAVATNKSESKSTAVDVLGNSYITGYFSGSVTFGNTTLVSAGNVDVYLAKYDNTGAFQWAKRAGGANNDIANGIAVSGNDIYITGYIGTGIANFNTPSNSSSNIITSAGSDDIFVAKYDNTGAFQWARRAGGTSAEYAYGIAASGNDVYITGYFFGTGNFNTPSNAGSNSITSVGSGDIFLAKYNSVGSFQWAKRAGGANTEIGYGVAISGSDVYITGSFQTSCNFNTPSATTNIITSPGTTFSYDIFLAKYNDTGAFQWARRAGAETSDFAYGIAVSGNDVYITGYIGFGTSNFNTPSDFNSNTITAGGLNINIFLAKYDNTGTFQWAKRGGGAGASIGYGVATSGSDVYITGYFRSEANFNTPSAFGSNEVIGEGSLQDIFLAKYDNTGAFQWVGRAGGAMEDVGYGVALSGSDIYISGFFRTTAANFNTPSTPGSNELSTVSATNEAFLVRYPSIPLPIELLSFKGQSTERGNLLTWTTASETQNKGFDIEASTDGVRFEKIGFVAGNGTTMQRQDYSFEDNTTFSFSKGESRDRAVYYRLKQLDFDGRFEYSKIIALDRKGKNVVSVFPNPSTGLFMIVGVKDIEDETFTLLNNVGQTLSIAVQNNSQIDLSAYPSGVYYLRIASSGQVMKLVKK